MAEAAACGCGQLVAYAVEPPLVVTVGAAVVIHESDVKSLAAADVVVEVAVLGHLCRVGLATVGVLEDGVAWHAAFIQEDCI